MITTSKAIMRPSRIAILSLGLLAAGCVTFPTGPSVMALPGGNRSFDEFRADDNECRNYAANSAGGPSAQQASIDAGAASAVIGTVIGELPGLIALSIFIDQITSTVKNPGPGSYALLAGSAIVIVGGVWMLRRWLRKHSDDGPAGN